MIRRLFWFAAGLTTGVWATVRVGNAARRMTPAGLAAEAAGRAVRLGGRARRFALEVRAGMAEPAPGDRSGPRGERPRLTQLPGQRPTAAPRRHPQRHDQKEGY
jgi:hypothetical protein